MKLSVSANFQDNFVDTVKKYPFVKEVYGKIPADFIGGGRPSFMIPAISKKKLHNLVQELKKNDISFNYLLNSTCLNNVEYTTKGYKLIRRELDWLANMGIENVTIAIPYLCEIVKRHYPNIKIKVSAFACVNTIQQVKLWEDLGANTITLEPQTMNREFKLLELISGNTNVEIQLIVNQGCLYSCPNVRYHSNLFSHASQKKHHLKGFLLDYCSLKCKYNKLKNKVNFIRSDWIRPEDIHVYESKGIHNFKIIQRNWTTDKLERIVKAYSEKSYNGNLADLTEFLFGKNIFLSKFRQFKYFFRPFNINLFKLWKLYKNVQDFESDVFIDNKNLEGFIDIFKKESCRNKDCEKCKYCHNIADKVVQINNEKTKDNLLHNFNWLLDRKHNL